MAHNTLNGITSTLREHGVAHGVHVAQVGDTLDTSIYTKLPSVKYDIHTYKVSYLGYSGCDFRAPQVHSLATKLAPGVTYS